jgi:alkylated DNA nucleotide flippase Atl1
MSRARDRFAIVRADGRSNQQVLLDFVRDGEPGRVYPYSELAAELGKGTETTYDARSVQQVVRQSAHRLSKEQARVLRSVKTIGYRLAPASEHVALALVHTRRSEVQLRRGFEVLAHVRLDDLDANQRRMHEGHMMITGALYQQQRHLWKKQQAVETALASLTARVDALAPDAKSQNP